ncbi:MAG: hypothetical protein V8R01_06350 [Bacilli bacterium]
MNIKKPHIGTEKWIRLLLSNMAPDTTAQIFWLKNRKPEIWNKKDDIPDDNSKVEELLLKIESEASDD